MAKTDLLQGTLDLLILRVLNRGSLHGWGIAQRIHRVSQDVLTVEEGSLYPASFGWSKKAGSKPNGDSPKTTVRRSITA
jgi:hypothetical protein